MNITKSLAEEVAKIMVQPIDEKIDKNKEIIRQMTDEVITSKLPPEVLKCYKKYPRYFDTSERATLCCGILQTSVTSSKFPSNCGWNPHYECSNEISEKIKNLEIEVNKAEREKKKDRELYRFSIAFSSHVQPSKGDVPGSL